MTAVAGQTPAAVLEQTARELDTVLANSEYEVNALAADFQDMAGDVAAILDAAGAIVHCAESERVLSVLPRVESSGRAATAFIQERLQAAGGILELIGAEAALLSRLSRLIRAQKAIVRETEMLRVLTNIEVARLGQAGESFQYLARELDDFSQTASRSIFELSRQTEERQRAVEEIRRALRIDLPRMREEFGCLAAGLTEVIDLAAATLSQLRETPARFSSSVEDIAARIAGVVAAIQTYDITRQQLEHVRSALALLRASPASPAAGSPLHLNRSYLRAGLTIQSLQLRNIDETVRGWISRIGGCLESIAHTASSDIPEIAPLVLGQARRLSAQLEPIQRLEQECLAANERVQHSMGSITELMQLVSDHLARSRSVRERLQLLMFNSIVEASHLGSQADGILEISRTIRRLAEAWSEMTSQSEAARNEIQSLVERSNGHLRIFSDVCHADLREVREQTRAGEEVLCETARCAASHGDQIQKALDRLHTRVAGISATSRRLESCFCGVGAALAKIESIAHPMDSQPLDDELSANREQLERQFSALYTTEVERAVLRAALDGAALPVAQPNLAGNDVELF